MIRSLFWIIIWMLTLCAASFHIRYMDGLEIQLNGWLKSGDE